MKLELKPIWLDYIYNFIDKWYIVYPKKIIVSVYDYKVKKL